MDGLAHLFIDRPHDGAIVEAIAASGAFMTPCLVLNSSIMGRTGTDLAADERVSSKLSKPWYDTLCSSFNTFPQGNFDDVLAATKALHDAGVDILVGTDASVLETRRKITGCTENWRVLGSQFYTSVG